MFLSLNISLLFPPLSPAYCCCHWGWKRHSSCKQRDPHSRRTICATTCTQAQCEDTSCRFGTFCNLPGTKGGSLTGLYLRNGCSSVVILIMESLLWLQCIQGLPEGALRRIILTASGGAFRFVTTKLFVKTNAWRRRKLKIDLLYSILGLWGFMT